MESARILLSDIVDYAGLFPPAALDMTAAVRNYAAYRGGDHEWALGRFVVPAARLDELELAASPHWADGARPWRLGALLGDDVATGVDAIAGFNERNVDRAVVDAVEAKASAPSSVHELSHAIDKNIELYVEVSIDDGLDALLAAIADTGSRAKMRTGGVTPEAFPSTAQLIRFINGCYRAGLPFKATAGLHHAVRALYRLTYDADSPQSIMHGFLNVFCASALVVSGGGADVARELIEEQSAAAFVFGDDGIEWRGYDLNNTVLRRTRSDFATSFGSCSFDEPIEDLKGMNLI